MQTFDAQTCEVKIDGSWRAISLDEAASQPAMAVKRCPACYSRVMILGAYSGPKARRSLQHRKAHDGCSLRFEAFCGTPSLHPQALA